MHSDEIIACYILQDACYILCDDLCEHYTWQIVYGTLGLESITLGVRKNKLNMIVLELNSIVLVFDI